MVCVYIQGHMSSHRDWRIIFDSFRDKWLGGLKKDPWLFSIFRVKW